MAEPGPPLSVERYAEVTAHLIHFRRAPREDVLGALGVEARDLDASDAVWMRGLIDEAIEEERPVTRAYQAAISPVLARLRADKLTLEEIAASRKKEAPVETVDAPPPAEPLEAAPLPDAPAPAGKPPEVDRAVASAWVVPAGMRHFADLRGTTLASSITPVRALPFAAKGPSAHPAPPPAPASTPAGPAPAASFVPAGMRHVTDLRGTSLPDPIAHRPTLPFQGARARAPETKMSPPPDAAAVARTGPPSQPSPALSGGPEASPDLAGLTIHQYASLCVELTWPGRDAGATLARYQLTADQHLKLDEHWRERFAREPDLRREWEQACVRYGEWISRSGASSAVAPVGVPRKI